MTSTTAFKTTMLMLWLITLCPGSTAPQEPPEDSSQFDVSPADIHRFLSEGKQRAMADRLFADKFLDGRGPANTQTNYDVLFYDIFIRVDDTNKILHGRVTFVALAAADGVSEVQVDFHAGMSVDSLVGPTGYLAYFRDGDVVTVVLDGVYNEGEQFQFDFYYHGHPLDDSSPYGGFTFHERPIISPPGESRMTAPVYSSCSQPYGARTWWPCKDRMDDKADSIKAAFQVELSFWVASNGRLDSVVFLDLVYPPARTHTFYYTEPHPIASYLFMMAMSDYWLYEDEWVYNDERDTMPIIHAVYPEWAGYAYNNYDVTPEVLTVLSESYGLYPFADTKYGHVNFEWWVAMEHQTMSSMLGSHPWGWGFWEYVVIHELAHQWWGDYITCESWKDIWLNEGWASYSEALYYQARNGNWIPYHDYMATLDHQEGGTIYRPDTTYPGVVFDIIVYDRAAWVVHMLRGVLGEELFAAGVEAYYNSEYANGSITTNEFVEVWEAGTGQELSWFFDAWVYGEYRPNYQFCYWSEPSDSGGYDAFLAVDQIQTTNPQVFQMPVDFVCHLTSGPVDTTTLWVGKRRNTYVFNFPDSLVDVQLDPRDWVMKYERDVLWRMHFVVAEDLPPAHKDMPYSVTLATRGGTGENTFSISAGSLPAGLSLDDQTGVITGVVADTGVHQFAVYVDDNYSNYWDETDFVLRVTHLPGDLDMSGGVDVTDLVYMVDYYFAGGPPPALVNLADIDGSCQLDIADLVYLVDYMFAFGPPPVLGCVE